MALGRAIVRELDLHNRGEVLERWLAHHLAELLSEADNATGAAKTAAEQRAVDTILKLWTHRRALPEPIDPLGGYRNAIAVLDRLMPEADPWKRYNRQGTYEALLSEMFQILTRSVLSGVLLTQLSRPLPVPEVECAALEKDEAYLREELGRLIPLIAPPPPIPEVVFKIVSQGAVEDAEDVGDCPEIDPGDLTPEQLATAEKETLQSAIVTNLERMETKLSALIARWKSATDEKSKLSGDAESEDDW